MGRILFWVILAIVLYVAFAFARGRRSSRVSNSKQQDGKKSRFMSAMIECPECGAYFPEEEAVLGDGKAYCSERCRKKARARKS